MKKLSFLIMLVIISFTLFGCGSEPTSDKEIVEIYTQLTLKDIESQKILENEEEANRLLLETYVEPALSQSLEGIQLMKANNVKRLFNSPKFENIEVLQNNPNYAILKVAVKFEGEEYTISSPNKNLGPFSFDYIAEVTLKRVKGKWYVSELKPISSN